jgi:nitrite reductase/ring-hydroxylating ferredoxin subunit
MLRKAEASQDGVVVAQVSELAAGETKKFILLVQEKEVECFLVNHNGQLYAYVNRCCHVPMTMDWLENQFLTEDGRYIMCATHGACYEPDTGECIFGPPCGEFLDQVPLSTDGDQVIAHTPVEQEE